MRRYVAVRQACFLAIMGVVHCAVADDSARQNKKHEVHRPPNVVIIFLDDAGWGDVQPFAEPGYETPHIAKLAREGCRFENFYVPQAVCSASRAALLSGCYPERTRVFYALLPGKFGLDPKFLTLAQVLKPQGYATGCFGKWHIGDQPQTRPLARGFDEACGLMYSNDMWEHQPVNPEFWKQYPLRFWEGKEVAIDRVTPQDQTNLTTWYTEHAVDFIERNREQPFLLYVPHSMPHVPLYCSEKFQGKSGAGLYGDVMLEIDWSVGEICKSLKAAGVEENTVVIFTSDNGPWSIYGNHAGKTPFRNCKSTSFDGGTRSACIIKYPGKIKANSTSTKAFCSVDLLPTIASFAGAALPEYPIDGKDVWPLVAGDPEATNPHPYYPFSMGDVLEAVLSSDGRWKLHLPHRYTVVTEPGRDGQPGKSKVHNIELSLFDLENDPSESTNVIDQHPEIARQLKALALKHRDQFNMK